MWSVLGPCFLLLVLYYIEVNYKSVLKIIIHLFRFLIYSYKMEHNDGRTSYPLCFIFTTPPGCKVGHFWIWRNFKLSSLFRYLLPFANQFPFGVSSVVWVSSFKSWPVFVSLWLAPPANFFCNCLQEVSKQPRYPYYFFHLSLELSVLGPDAELWGVWCHFD